MLTINKCACGQDLSNDNYLKYGECPACFQENYDSIFKVEPIVTGPDGIRVKTGNVDDCLHCKECNTDCKYFPF